MNISSLAALGLFSIALCLILTGCLLGIIPLVEGVDVTLDSQQPPIQEPFRSVLTDSPVLAAMLLFSFLGIPGSILAVVAYGLWWFVGRRRPVVSSPTSDRRVLSGQAAGLVSIAVGLVPLLFIVPIVILAPLAIPVQREAGLLPPAEHPILVFVMVLLILAAGPCSFGSGLLALARRNRRALGSRSPSEVESEDARACRERWNLRLGRVSWFLGSGVALTLVAISVLVLCNVTSEYLVNGVQMRVQEQIALTPRGYLTGISLLAMPGLISIFLIVGIRVVLVRPDSPPAARERE